VRVNELGLHVEAEQRETIPQFDVGDYGFLGDHLVLEVLDGVGLNDKIAYTFHEMTVRRAFANYDGLRKEAGSYAYSLQQ